VWLSVLSLRSRARQRLYASILLLLILNSTSYNIIALGDSSLLEISSLLLGGVTKSARSSSRETC
jgi:hypothetical protein